jgi:hypothetical protein
VVCAPGPRHGTGLDPPRPGIDAACRPAHDRRGPESPVFMGFLTVRRDWLILREGPRTGAKRPRKRVARGAGFGRVRGCSLASPLQTRCRGGGNALQGRCRAGGVRTRVGAIRSRGCPRTWSASTVRTLGHADSLGTDLPRPRRLKTPPKRGRLVRRRGDDPNCRLTLWRSLPLRSRRTRQGAASEILPAPILHACSRRPSQTPD